MRKFADDAFMIHYRAVIDDTSQSQLHVRTDHRISRNKATITYPGRNGNACPWMDNDIRTHTLRAERGGLILTSEITTDRNMKELHIVHFGHGNYLNPCDQTPFFLRVLICEQENDFTFRSSNGIHDHFRVATRTIDQNLIELHDSLSNYCI